jgi:hypothetical protein
MTQLFDRDILHPILAKWLRGTTCYTYWVGRSVLLENDDYIVLKHNSHASYCGRFSDNLACRAFAALYRKSDLSVDDKGYNRNLDQGVGSVKRWEGRINKSVVRDDCQQMGIVFTSETPI